MPLKWSLALTEIVGVVVMTAAFSAFLCTLVGRGPAGVGMLLLAFAILPNQGIFSFIPSTMALSLAMLLWVYLLRRRERANAPAVLCAATCISAVHPVGPIYVCVGIGIYGAVLGLRAFFLQRRPLYVSGAAIAGIGCSLVFYAMSPTSGTAAPKMLGNVSIVAGLSTNLASIGPFMLDPVLRKNGMLVLLTACALCLGGRRFVGGTVGRIALVLGCALGISLAHALPGYPAELFSRIFVPVVVVAAGVAGRFATEQFEQARYRKVRWTLAVLGICLTGVLWVDYFFHTMNLRPEVIRDARVRDQIARLPTQTTFLYGEANISVLSVLLLGGQQHGALVLHMLGDTPAAEALLRERRPDVVVLPNFRQLNSLSTGRSKRLTPRRHGFYLPAVASIVLRLSRGTSGRDLHLFISNDGEPFLLPYQIVRVHGGIPISTAMQIPGRYAGWLAVQTLELADGAALTFLPNNHPAWIEGVSVGPPRPHVMWPWDAGVGVEYQMQNGKRPRGGTLRFTLRELLAEYDALRIEALLPRVDRVLSDDSGLVFLRTRYHGDL
jgi:hypothetical protein